MFAQLMPNSDLVVISLLIWSFMFLVYKKAHNEDYVEGYVKNRSYLFVFVFLSLSSVFAFAELDTYNYYRLFYDMKLSSSMIHVEEFYYWLTTITDNYFLWRFLIWGTSAGIIVYSCKKQNISASSLGLMIPLFFMKQFSITRASLAFAIMVLVVDLFYNEKRNRILRIILAIIGIYLSYFLHRSMPIFIAILVASHFIGLNRKTVIISLVAFPFLYFSLKYWASNYLGILFLDESSTDFIVDHLNEEKVASLTNWGIISSIIEWLPKFLLFYVLIKEYIFDSNKLPNQMRFYLKSAYVLFYLACLFFGQEMSSYMSPRTLHACSFFLLMIGAHYLSNDYKYKKIDKAIIFSSVVSCLFGYFYFIYKW